MTYIKAMRIVDGVFRRMELRYWLAFGTVLGFHREGGVIKNDTDVDYSCKVEDLWPERYRLANKLRRAGFSVSILDEKKRIKLVVKRKNVVIGIAGFRKYGKYRYRNKWRIPEKFFGKGNIKYRGAKFPCHSPIEKYLRWVYSDWKTPAPKTDGLRIYTKSVLRK